MPVKHNLYKDLGLSEEVVLKRRASDDSLDRLLTQYAAIDEQVVEAESRKAADQEVELLKKKRLSVKDQIVSKLG